MQRARADGRSWLGCYPKAEDRVKNFHIGPLLIGAALGAVVAFIAAKGMGANTENITGGFAAPYQANIDRGGRR